MSNVSTPGHLLLVEDNPDHAELILNCLRECHHDLNTTHLHNGEEALNFLMQRGEYAESARPDLILLDLRMPKVDGLEVIKHVKNDEQLRRIPVVVLTTSKANVDAAKAYDLHANSYLLKPYDFDELYALLNALDQYWMHHNYSHNAIDTD